MVIHISDSKINFLSKAPYVNIPYLHTKEVEFYSKCYHGPLTLGIGDCVLISNADLADPESLENCYIGRILHLYELLNEKRTNDPYRAIIQWYSRPKDIDRKFYNKEISINYDIEFIEEHRPYHNDISIETIFRKCTIIMGNKYITAENLLKNNSNNSTKPTYVCRYKFIKYKSVYKLVSLDENGAEISNKSQKTTNSGVKRSSDRIKTHNLEFIDLNKFNNVISPLKTSYIQNSPNKSLNHPSAKKIRAACRNLNNSLNDETANSTAGSDILNYSIINDNSPERNEMIIKLKLSASQSASTRRSSSISVRSELSENFQRKRSSVSVSDEVMSTPIKKIKEVSSSAYENTPRRRSIMKTPSESSTKTTRRSVFLSNIVEERFIQENSIVSTPTRNLRKRSTSKKTVDLTSDDDDMIEEIFNGEKDKNFDNHPITPKRNSRNETPKKKTNTKQAKDDTFDPQTPRTKSETKRQTEIQKNSHTIISKTPTRKLKLSSMTPTLENRKDYSPKSAQSNLQVAREKLHVSAIPDSLPCREDEFENIFSFLHNKILDECGGCMYVSGVPGTGKTATTTGVIRYLKEMVKKDELPQFDFIEINGMKLTEPRQAYVQIYKQLTGKTASWEQAHSLLEKRFSTPAPRRATTVILVDELDILCNRRQDVVYNLLDWPSKTVAKLVVITIANTMDLPERLLMGKVTSRLGLTRLTFQPYTHKQLQEIVTTRLSGSEAFNGDAVQLVARKVAAVSGDARRALDICRRATEIANDCEKNIVNMTHVQQALQEMIASAQVQAIKNCSRLEQLFLQAVAAEVARTGVEETIFSGVYSQLEAISILLQLPIPSPGNALKICSKLSSIRLLICEHSKTDIFQKILLNVSADDIHYALDVNMD